jgi:hypothetical protein
LTRQPVRVCRYDAYWPDGHVDFDVNLVQVMYRGQPADFEPVRIAVHEECPEYGAGPWIDRTGQVVDGPEPKDPDWLKPGVGRPIPYRRPGKSSGGLQRTVTYAWRIGPGLIAFLIGILLLLRSPGASAVGLLGALCILLGAASIVSLITSLRRRHRR